MQDYSDKLRGIFIPLGWPSTSTCKIVVFLRVCWLGFFPFPLLKLVLITRFKTKTCQLQARFSLTLNFFFFFVLQVFILFVWLVANGWCWFVVREKYCWLVAGGWFVLREKYCWLAADKPNEQAAWESWEGLFWLIAQYFSLTINLVHFSHNQSVSLYI
jgi:hypothetical protein